MIDQADYAVLNAVSENEWPAYLLNGAAGMENLMNRPTHGLGTKGLIEHFSRLWHTGLLECSFEESGTALFPDMDLARGQFERDSDDNPIGPIVWYRLSRVGGDLWEKLTSPDWSKFIRSGAGQASSTWIHASGDRARVELLRKCPIPPIPVPGTERWEVCEPWRATYWKTVERGYELRFTYDPELRTGLEGALGACDELWRTWYSWRKSFEEVCQENFGQC